MSAFSVSLDGYGAGPNQDLQNPLGIRGLELHSWFQETAVFRQMHNQPGAALVWTMISPSAPLRMLAPGS